MKGNNLIELNFKLYRKGLLDHAERLYIRLQQLLSYSKYKGENGYFNILLNYLKKHRSNKYSFLSDLHEVIYIDSINNPMTLDTDEYLKNEDVILLLEDIKEDFINTLKRFKEYW
jgi:hypothetical protein|nr:MAG TPA: hypothetical protein [Caudoviricetes sp.]